MRRHNHSVGVGGNEKIMHSRAQHSSRARDTIWIRFLYYCITVEADAPRFSHSGRCERLTGARTTALAVLSIDGQHYVCCYRNKPMFGPHSPTVISNLCFVHEKTTQEKGICERHKRRAAQHFYQLRPFRRPVFAAHSWCRRRQQQQIIMTSLRTTPWR